MRRLATALLPTIASIAFASASAAADVAVPARIANDARLQPAQHARVALIADHAAVAPGQALRLGLRIVHDAGWHTYWANSGDSGLPTRFDWTLPAGASAGAIEWPLPERLLAAGLTNFGYSGALLLPAPLTVPRDAAIGGHFEARLRARWLICEEACIPDEATLTIRLPVEARARPSGDAGDFEATLSTVPRLLPAAGGHSWRDATHVATQVDGASAWVGDATRIEVFPLTPQLVTSTRIEARLGADGALRFRHPASEYFDRMPERADWVLGLQGRDGSWRAVQLSLPAEDARSP